MQAVVDDVPYMQFSLPLPVQFINPYLGTIQYSNGYQVLPHAIFPMHHPDLVSVPAVPGVMYQVWKSNLKYEFQRIEKLIETGGRWFASIDTEFPGTIYKCDKGRLHDPEYNYNMMKKNVNDTKIIQLGLTLADLHQNIYTWEFNFNDFDIHRDLQDKDSIEFLELHGINFCRHKEDGIPSHVFAKLCEDVGLLGNSKVELTWIGFQISYDLGFFTKILEGKLPNDFATYKKAELRHFGDRVHDVKVMIRNSFPTLYGGLDKVAETLGIARVIGKSHQAGSDSLLTYLTFIKLKSAQLHEQHTPPY